MFVSECHLFLHCQCCSRGRKVRYVGSREVLCNLRKNSRDIKSPIILQVSQGGSAYFAGKGLANDKQQASIVGAVAAAHHIRTVAKAYGMYVSVSLAIDYYCVDLSCSQDP
jgi:fructose/tagatose bisphosphate aldolase